ncbi:unnamed protein product [Rhizophagus irregularis]|nr:unnamed protein product [Rhizophagus irregularis]
MHLKQHLSITGTKSPSESYQRVALIHVNIYLGSGYYVVTCFITNLDQLSSFSITNDQVMIADSIIDSRMDDQISRYEQYKRRNGRGFEEEDEGGSSGTGIRFSNNIDNKYQTLEKLYTDFTSLKVILTLRKMTMWLEKSDFESCDVIIMGDFNDHSNKEKRLSYGLVDLEAHLNMEIANNKFTRSNNNSQSRIDYFCQCKYNR